MRAMGIGEPIRILKASGESHPLEFAWRGRRHYVRTIERYRSDVERRGSKVQQRKRYQLITADGLHYKFFAAETRPFLRHQDGVGRGGAAYLLSSYSVNFLHDTHRED